jgi:BirA family transcriptional regulator, biotin operon repressor / biotin---[acetyl-CoA-carboxylase] ligase
MQPGPLSQTSFEGVIQQLTALGALAVHTALKDSYGLTAQIKWPNDVLINRLKVAGVLAEAHWMGDQFEYAILGIGINIAPPSITWASGEFSKMDVAVTCLHDAAGKEVNRLEVLHDVLKELLVWRSHLETADFINAWEARLAFKGEWVIIYQNDQFISEIRDTSMPTIREGQILGLAENGSLVLRSPEGEIFKLSSGEVRIRPMIELNSGI